MIHIIQISGAGNTFSLVLENAETQKLSDRRQFVRDVCSATNTDGFIFLNWRNKGENLLSWDFYNNDGSDAEMCGNATRCVGYYVRNVLKIQNNILNLETVAGEILIEIISDDTFEVTMTPVEKFEHHKYFWCDTGVPHIVFEIENFFQYEKLKTKCRELRFHQDFLPRGTNVTLVELSSELNKLKAVSYERGVEDFTQACGTGAMAAAFYNFEKRQQKETFVEMPGGVLKMNLENLNKPKMTGQALKIGEYNYEN